MLPAILLSALSYGQSSQAQNYLNVPGPIAFNNSSYKLSWTSHPAANYYKQEYIPAGETAEKFKSMAILEVLTGKVSVKDIVSAKTQELKSMKSANPYVNFESFYNKELDEYLLDFLVTANSADNKSINIAERNVYRYKVFTDAAGQKGVLLFAVSTRSYGKDVTKFLETLKATKADLVNKVRQFAVPAVKIKN